MVKAYVREAYETRKFSKANANIYNMFLRAEKLVVLNMPLMQATVYTCILVLSWLGAKTYNNPKTARQKNNGHKINRSKSCVDCKCHNHSDND